MPLTVNVNDTYVFTLPTLLMTMLIKGKKTISAMQLIMISTYLFTITNLTLRNMP